MDTLEKLVALEDIRRLLARRVRCIDEKDWDGFADCYTEDAVSWSVPVPGQPGDPTVGNRLIADRVAADHGSIRATPNGAKSFTLRVATAAPFLIAQVAIKASMGSADAPCAAAAALSRPACSATSGSISTMRPMN